ncbi:MAG: galactokinase family protein [Pseudomonadota bacterium]
MTTQIIASAPGSIMITGEHAVVYGHPAMVCAIDQRITITAERLTTRQLDIHSEIAAPYCVDFDALEVAGPYRFILAALARYRDRIDHGVRLTVASAIDPTLGLGSSAAVTMASLGIFSHCAGQALDDKTRARLHGDALAIIRAIQGRGSGADLAASLYGGMISYQLPASMLTGVPQDGHGAAITALPAPPPLSLGYAGYKTPTGEVLAHIAKRMQGHEAQYDALYKRMGHSAGEALTAAKAADHPVLARHLNDYQGLMVELGVSDPVLDGLVQTARGTDGVLAAKISGSGLGECVLAMGGVPDGFAPAPLATQGLQIDD